MQEETAPSTILSSVEDGASGVPVNGAITVTFSKPIVPSSVTPASFFLVSRGPASSSLALSRSYDSTICGLAGAVSGGVGCSSSTTCSFTPDAPLESEWSYALCLTTDILYADGSRYPGMMIFFTTADAASPGVLNVTPAAGAADVAVNASVQAVFDEDMDGDSIDGAGFTLASGVASVEGAVSYHAGARTAVFTPSSNLSSFTTYTATVGGSVRDDAGNALGTDYAWSFTTSDVIAPTITSVTPANGATGVSVDASIEAIFSEEMDSSTLDLDSFLLGGLAGSVDYAPATMTATFDPAAALSYYTDYTATVTTGARDVHGLPLASDYLWGFRTEHAPVSSIASKGYHSLVLKTDGTVWAWGQNSHGQLGDDTVIDRSTPSRIAGISDASAVAGGMIHSLVLREDGTVAAFGSNLYGQLGDGTTTNRTSPVPVSGLADVSAVSGGVYHSLALQVDGTVWGWGYNGYGQLGDGTTTQRLTPVQTSGFGDVIAIAGGGYHSLALKADGTVWTWGYNSFGQLGDGTTTQRTTPVQVCKTYAGGCTEYLTGVTAIAVGTYYNLALKVDGTVWAWGYNSSGQLGDGTTTNRTTAVQVSGLADVIAIAGGLSHGLALKADGTVWAWGNNDYGQIGDGTTTNRTTPVQASGIAGVISITGGYSHVLVLKADGTVWAWGMNYHGELGDGMATYYQYTPRQVVAFGSATSVGSGSVHTVVRRTDGTVWSHGKNSYGQLGDGTTTDSATPVQAIGLADVSAVAAGESYHTLALKTDGTVWAWGQNNRGQLGDGTTTQRTAPVQTLGLTDVSAVDNTYYHSVAVKADGTAWGWGYNVYGQLGDGTTTQRTTPVQVCKTYAGACTEFFTGVSSIAAGWTHTLAVRTDGTAWAWGHNNHGQLGDGTTTQRTIPVQVCKTYTDNCTEYLTGVIAISGGLYYSLALKTDGTVWAWGYNDRGQLGDGTRTDRTTPVQILSGANGISAGGYYGLATMGDGTVWAWGSGTMGQVWYGALGDGTTAERLTPVQVVGPGGSGYFSGVSSVVGGRIATIALKTDNSVWEWGWTGVSPLLDGTYPYSTTAVQVDWPE